MLFPDRFVFISRHEHYNQETGQLSNSGRQNLDDTATRLAAISNYYGLGGHNTIAFSSPFPRTQETARGLIQFMDLQPEIVTLDWIGLNERGHEFLASWISQKLVEREDVQRVLGILVITHAATSARLLNNLTDTSRSSREKFSEGECWLALPVTEKNDPRQTICLSNESSFKKWIDGGCGSDIIRRR